MGHVSGQPPDPRLTRRRFAAAAPLAGFGAGMSWLVPFRTARAQALHTLKPLSLPSPNASVEAADGREVRLADFRPTPLLLNFWASWCPPCLRELPTREGLDKALRERGMAVALVGVDREGREFGERFLRERGVDVPISLHDGKRRLARAMDVRVMPSSYLIGGGGTVRGLVEGPEEWDAPAVVDRVVQLLS